MAVRGRSEGRTGDQAVGPAPSQGGWLAKGVWGLLLALVLLRAAAMCLHPPPPAAGDPARLLGKGGATAAVELQGTLLSDSRPLGESGGCSALLQLPVGRSELRLDPCPTPLQQGWRVAATGRLRRPRPAPHPLLSGPAERLARQEVNSQLQVESLQVLAKPATPVADLRRRLAGSLIEGAGAERGGILAALVLGSAVTPLPLAVREAFRAAGLSHALAASGFHLTVLLGVVLPVAQRLPCACRLLLAGGAMGAFILLAGPQPSVLRAVLMAAMALLALEAGRRGRPLGLLAASALLLVLVQPRWLGDVGFQLSVVATAALMVSAGPLEQGLRRLLPGWCGGWLAQACAVPLAACLWTLPLQLQHFGVVPAYAVLANLLAAPLLTPLTLGAMLLALAGVLLPAVMGLLLPPLAWLAGLLLAISQGVAALPMAQWQLGRPAPLPLLLLTAGLLLVLLPAVGARWRRAAPALLALAAVWHLNALRTDQLLLVHQGAMDLLVARHQGRGALVSLGADGGHCQQARQLAQGLGISRFDWALLLDPRATEQAPCWQQLAGLTTGSADGVLPMQPGQRLTSPGLSAEPLDGASRGVQLLLNRHRWLLLPDRQALRSWRDRPADPAGASRLDGLWLGFRPNRADQTWLRQQAVTRIWISGPRRGTWPAGWRASGSSGSLHAEPG
jgi:competence protein ComEC